MELQVSGHWAKILKDIFQNRLLVGLRAKMTTLCGVMITASHNHKDDNGVKIVEQDGSMLDQLWEPLAEKLANSQDIYNTLENFDTSLQRSKYGFMETIFAEQSFTKACFGMDTR